MPRQVDELYYTLRLRTDGLPADEAAAKAQMNEIVRAVEKTGAQVEQITKETVRRSAQAATEAVAEAVPAMQKIARQMTQTLRDTFEQEKEKIKIALQEGLLTAAEAQNAGRKAAMSYNSGVVNIMANFSSGKIGMGAIGAGGKEGLLGGLRNELVAVDAAATAASYGGLSYIRRPLTTLADQALGVNRSVGTLASGLGAFGLGQPLTIGILAAVAAIVYGFDLLTKSARAAQEQIDKVIASLEKERKEEAETASQRALGSRDIAQGEVNRLQTLVANLTAAQKNAPNLAAQGVRGASLIQKAETDALADATKDLANARLNLAQANKDVATSDDKMQSTYSVLLSTNAKKGAATKQQIEDLKLLSDQAKKTLASFNASPVAQATYAVQHPNDPEAVLKYQQQLKEQADAYDNYIKDKDKKAATSARKEETLRREVVEYNQQVNGELAKFSLNKGEDSLDNQIAKVEEAGKRAHIPLAQVAQDVAKIKEAFSAKADVDASDALAAAKNEALGPIGRMQNQLAQLVKNAHDKGWSNDIIQQIVAIKQPAIDAAIAVEKLSNDISEVEANRAARAAGVAASESPIADMAKLNDDLASANATLATTSRGTTEWREALAKVLSIMREIKGLQDDTQKAINDDDKGTKAAESALQKRVHDMARAVNDAVSLASEFGKMDQNTANVVKAVNEGAQAFDEFAKGNYLQSAILAVHAGVDAVKGLLGIHGKSPEQKALEAVLTANTQALLKLNETYGSVGSVTATGAQQAAFDKVLARTDVTGGTKANAQKQTYSIQNQLEAMGYTIGDFRAYAQQFGIKLSDAITGQEFAQLQQAVKDSNVTKYADNFAGQMQNLQTTLKLFDITQATDQFTEFKKALDGVRGGSGALGKALDSFDLTTAHGVDVADKMLQDLYERAQAGTLTSADLGGLSGQDFIDAIGQVKDIIDATPAGGTGGYNVSQTITQASSDRMLALDVTRNDWLSQIAMYTAASARALGANVTLPPLVAPPVAANTAAAGGFVININLPANLLAVGDPYAFGSKIGQGAAAEISKAMGSTSDWNVRASGEAALN